MNVAYHSDAILRNLFEKVVTQQAKRTVGMSENQTDELSTITEDDVINALAQINR